MDLCDPDSIRQNLEYSGVIASISVCMRGRVPRRCAAAGASHSAMSRPAAQQRHASSTSLSAPLSMAQQEYLPHAVVPLPFTAT